MRALSPAQRRPSLTVFAVLVLTLALVTPLVPQQVALANPFEVVTNLDDSGDGSLRQAIADVDPGGEITFQEGLTGTITLGSQLFLDKDLTITGPGADILTVSGNNAVRVFFIDTLVEVEISGLTISGGRHNNTGGGIYNDSGKLTILDSVVSGNIVAGGSSAVNGGGIYTLGFNATLTIIRSTISGNTADGGSFTARGGGIYNLFGTVNITNSTISGNATIGAGINGRGGGIHNDGSLTITSSTIANNSGTWGSGIFLDGGEANVQNSIVANALTVTANCVGVFTSSGHNLATDASCFLDEAPDIVAPDLELGGLANNGGPTQTHAFEPESPAFNAIPAADCPATDQRGVSRPQGNACDTGAFELDVPDPPTIDLPTQPIVEEATSPGGTTVEFNHLVSAMDWDGNVLEVDCDPESGETFPITDTTVECEATDEFEQTVEGSFTVTVQDTTSPTLTAPEHLVVPATSPKGATADYPTPTATDLVDESVNVTCSPPSGSLFPIGTTTVACEAEDASGNEAAPISFDVTVLGAKAQIVQLIQDTRGMDIPTGPKLTIRIFLQMAGRTVDRYPAASCRFLETTAGLVASFTPRYIDRADAADILADIRRIRASMGC